MSTSTLAGTAARPDSSAVVGDRGGPADRLPRTAAGAGYVALLVVPSLITVLRYTSQFLNADGVQQSTMSVQGVRLFYWGQDRLFPAVSIIASPVSNPVANLWVCLLLQALSLYGLLLFVAHRVAANLQTGVPAATAVVYLALVVGVNGLLSPQMIHSFALEGQPYALSWLLAGLAYEAWRRGGAVRIILGVIAGVVALGLNPSAVLLALFLATTDIVRHRRFVRWIGFLIVFAVGFVIWSLLASQFGMYPTPARDPAPNYLGFDLQLFRTGFSTVVDNLVAQLRPVRTAVLVLVGLLAATLLTSRIRALLLTYGVFFAGFAVLFTIVFTGNNWVMLNGYHFRYFFPVPLLIVMAVAIPVAAAVLRGVQTLRTDGRSPRSARVGARLPLLATGLGLVVALLSMAGPIVAPQHARVLAKSERTARFVQANDIRFISGGYWNMWPLMHDALGPGRDSIYVAGFKTAGDRADFRAVFDRQMRERGEVQALCVDDTVQECAGYLNYWTRSGWTREGQDAGCPAPPSFGPSAAESSATGRSCQVLVNRGGVSA